jgi:hypothetical protein
MKTFRSKSVALLGLCLSPIVPLRSAAADQPATDKSIATQLFKEGRALLDQGHVGPACRKLEESQRIDPGGGTLLNLALCHEREGRAATAWVEFTEALGLAKRDSRPQRIEFARVHIAQLEPVLSRLVIDVSAAADLPDLEVKRDGTFVGRAAWGSPIPIDPGDHVIEATAPGRAPWRQAVVIGARADTQSVLVPALVDAVAQDSPSSAPSAPVGRPAATPRPAPEVDASSYGSSPRDQAPATPAGVNAPAWIALGVGVAASGLGAYFALHANSLKDDADGNCPNDGCSALGATQNSDAIKFANFATASFAVGLVGFGVGAILFATRAASHSAASAAPAPPITLTAGDLSVGPGRGEFTISGRW